MEVPFELASPTHLQIEVTEDCNHSCFYCYNHWRTDNFSKNKMTYETAKVLLEKIVSEIKPFHVVITGGEPLMNKDVTYYLMENLKKSEIDYNLNSNLILFNDKDFQNLIRINPKTNILTSLPSHKKEKFWKITGKNNISLFYENLKKSSDKNLNVVPNMVVHKLNKDDVYDEGRYLYENFGIKSFCATPVLKPAGRNVSFYLDNTETAKVFEDLIKLREDFGLQISSLEVIPRCSLPEEIRNEKIFQRSCTAGKSSFMIGYDGKIRACGHSPLKEGDLLSQNFQDIWEELKPYRKGEYIPSECKDCLEVLSCRGGCRFEGFENGDLISKKDSRMTEVLRKPITRNSINISSEKDYTLEEFKVRKENENQYTIYNGNIIYANEGLKKFMGLLKNNGDRFALRDFPNDYQKKAEALGKVLLNAGFLREYDKTKR